MILIAWNCREIGHPATVRQLKDLALSHRPDVMFLAEVKCNNTTSVQRLAVATKFDHFEFVPSIRKAGGLILMWTNNVNMKVVSANTYMINCLIFDDIRTSPWQFTPIYGPPIPSLRPYFLDYLSTVGATFQGPWLVTGDFNMVLNQAENLGGRPVGGPSRGSL